MSEGHTEGVVRRPHPDAESRERAVSRLGRYAILGALGRGGMGEVFRARAFGAEGATKEICLKRIRAARLTDRESIARFVDEARLSLALTHANIVSTFDFGRAENDYYLAMEWIDGADLARIIDASTDEPFSPALVAHVGAEVARALAYAHEPSGARPGIVHCDVKPSNVLVSRSGDVLLADFGVAVARLEGMRGGTPRYMAPEQRVGAEVGPAVDVYALGVVLREMVARASSSPEPLTSLFDRMTSEAPGARPAAHEIVAMLERFVARARLDGEPAPRDALGRRAAAAAPVLDETPSMLVADASYLRDGERSTETRLTATTTSSRSTPPPPAAPPRRRLAAWSLVITTIVIGSFLSMRSGSPRLDPPRAEIVPAAEPVSPATSIESPTVAVRAEPLGAAAQPDPPVVPAPDVPTTTAPDAPRRARARHVEEPPPPAPVAEAHLRINAIPWATVELDGRSLGTTPLTDVLTTAGVHELRFQNEVLGVDRRRSVTLEADEHRDVIVDLR